MRKLHIEIGIAAFIVVIIEIIMLSNIKTDYVEIRPDIEPIPKEISVEVVEYRMHTRDCEVVVFPKNTLEDSEIQLMAEIVHAEAGNQDYLGKKLIADVILNRVDSDSFPNTVTDVCKQNYQFAKGKSYTDEDMQAVIDELEHRTDSDVVFFRTDYFHTFGVPTYQHGDHYFSKEDL